MFLVLVWQKGTLKCMLIHRCMRERDIMGTDISHFITVLFSAISRLSKRYCYTCTNKGECIKGGHSNRLSFHCWSAFAWPLPSSLSILRSSPRWLSFPVAAFQCPSSAFIHLHSPHLRPAVHREVLLSSLLVLCCSLCHCLCIRYIYSPHLFPSSSLNTNICLCPSLECYFATSFSVLCAQITTSCPAL